MRSTKLTSPYFLECRTYRLRAHSMFDPQLYRDKSEVESPPQERTDRWACWAMAGNQPHVASGGGGLASRAEIDAEIVMRSRSPKRELGSRSSN